MKAGFELQSPRDAHASQFLVVSQFSHPLKKEKMFGNDEGNDEMTHTSLSIACLFYK